MKIAFDVNGTLDGSKKDLLIEVLHELQNQGHECIVWSSDYSMAKKCVESNNLNCEYSTKYTKIDCRNQDIEFVDVAIDDDSDSVRILGAKKVMIVGKMPESMVNIINEIIAK